MSKKNLYRCAIVGCGDVAGGYGNRHSLRSGLTHAGGYRVSPDTKLVALADPNKARRKAFQYKWSIRVGYSDYRTMLEKEAIDILSITLPTEKHYEVFEYAVSKNVPALFCEKPLSYDLAEARRMRELARGRVIAVNYFRRWNRDLAKLREELSSGRRGRVVSVLIRYTKGIKTNATHMIDLMRWFFGEPIEIERIAVYKAKGMDQGADFRLKFPGGINTIFLHVPEVPYVFVDADILTERGRIVIGQRAQEITRYNIGRDKHYGFNVLRRSRRTKTEWEICVARAISDIVECLKNKKKPACGPQDGFRALEICRDVLTRTNADKSVYIGKEKRW